MKILLTTLNAKYVHSNLALRYLRGVCPQEEIEIREYTINDRLDVVAGDIYKAGAQVIGFSCYIWNIEQTLELANILRQVSPESIIIFGGPEVSYDPGQYLNSADYVVFGEGEKTFQALIELLKVGADNGAEPSVIPGLAYHGANGPQVNPARELIRDLGEIPSPYEKLDGLENKIAYVESSRGCPFNCQYCLSSTFQGVRFFPGERTKTELKELVEAGVKQVKFVDRTFNCHKPHTLDLMKFIAAWNPPANFHFEISADLLDEETLEFLHGVPAGLFQFEVGVQSTNSKTLDLIQRRTDLYKLQENVRRVAHGGNIVQLLDLIAGLPGEDYRSFAQSFNEVYALGPDKLQLGFLKMLKGSGVRRRAEEWGYKYTSVPPYRVLANQWLSHSELLKLQVIEDLVDRFFNSGRFQKSLSFLIKRFGGSPFAMFEDLAEFWETKGLHRQAHNARTLYDLMHEYCLDREFDGARFRQLLKFDYLMWEKPNKVPDWFMSEEIPGFKQRVENFYRAGILNLMPQLQQVSKREINKAFHLEPFDPGIATDLAVEFPDTGEPLYLLFYYPGQLLKAPRPGFIPVMI